MPNGLGPSMRALLADRFMPAGGQGTDPHSASYGPSERQALNAGYARAQADGSATGSLDDFMIDMAALYQHAEENDPRHRTWFGDSLSHMMADPSMRSKILSRAAQQKKAY